MAAKKAVKPRAAAKKPAAKFKPKSKPKAKANPAQKARAKPAPAPRPTGPSVKALTGYLADAHAALSLRQLAIEFEVTPADLSRWLTAADVAPVHQARTAKFFRLVDVIPVAAPRSPLLKRGGGNNPRAEMEQIRLERDRIALAREAREQEEAARNLLPREDVVIYLRSIVRQFVEQLSILPDELERVCGAGPDVVETLDQLTEAVVAQVRERIASHELLDAAGAPAEFDDE